MRTLCILLCFGAALTVYGGAASGATVRPPEPVINLPQWPDFSARQMQSLQSLSNCEQNEASCETPEVKRWAGLIGDLRAQGKLRQIITVNKWFNRLPYKYDDEDYWADTLELLQQRGDCEDYALSKYYPLRELGFAPEQLQVTVVYDKESFINHAVLMVYIDGTRYMMDINSDQTEPSAMGKRYKPLYSFNEQTAWFY
jgi:predicted transglutaminase-like cysteine proteinase